jgi:hypothetical protein
MAYGESYNFTTRLGVSLQKQRNLGMGHFGGPLLEKQVPRARRKALGMTKFKVAHYLAVSA